MICVICEYIKIIEMTLILLISTKISIKLPAVCAARTKREQPK